MSVVDRSQYTHLRDGGFFDYHLTQRYTERDDEVTLFFNHQERIIPGWMDKKRLQRRPPEEILHNVLMVFPSESFVQGLPGGKVPDRDDITAFIEGTNFPFASPDFDDRVDGWQVIAGITVRLNDRRVLTSSLKKAEAEIRSYRAQIAAEENDIRDQITIRADRLLSYFRSRSEITDNISRSRAQFEERCEAYFWRQAAKMTIDDVLTPLYMLTDAQVQLAANLNQITDAENDLLVATGEVYRLVGIQIEKQESGTELYEAAASQPASASSQPGR